MLNKEYKLLSPEETAEILGVSKDTLNVWRSTNKVKIPFLKIGSKVKYDLEDINNFLKEHTFNKEVCND